MCELLGMNCNVPTDIRFSFSGLIQRGGRTGEHSDGWGIAFYEGRGCRTFHDPQASCDSEIANLVQSHSVKSLNVICHIRKATNGRICLENTHPFTRELWGRSWAFAHNGRLKGIKSWPLHYYQPIGTTDSEHAFCWILDQIRQRFPEPPTSDKALRDLIRGLADKVSTLGVFNMLLCDSRFLYCYCSTELTWLTRRAPFGKASLIDTEMTVDFRKETSPKDVVTVIATRPLTHDEPWQAMAPGSMALFRDGLLVGR
ncbi:MAG: class II glutamine amidotransferase [Methyloligellaceae bacterium]